jgi:uncharacterized phiE125 gp8 family phage protein
MSIAIVTPADAEPLTVADAKHQIPWPQSDSTWDVWIQSAIVAARQFAETKTQKTFCTSVVRETLDCFPRIIRCDTWPIQSITTIEYLDFDGTWQTVDPTLYTSDLDAEPARITPKFGRVWPIPVPQIGAVRLTYVAGYGGPEKVPEGIKTWMKMRIAAMFQNREEVVVGSRLTVSELPFVDGMLDNFRVTRF